jgi:hypothetical protein
MSNLVIRRGIVAENIGEVALTYQPPAEEWDVTYDQLKTLSVHGAMYLRHRLVYEGYGRADYDCDTWTAEESLANSGREKVLKYLDQFAPCCRCGYGQQMIECSEIVYCAWSRSPPASDIPFRELCAAALAHYLPATHVHRRDRAQRQMNALHRRLYNESVLRKPAWNQEAKVSRQGFYSVGTAVALMDKLKYCNHNTSVGRPFIEDEHIRPQAPTLVWP